LEMTDSIFSNARFMRLRDSLFSTNISIMHSVFFWVLGVLSTGRYCMVQQGIILNLNSFGILVSVVSRGFGIFFLMFLFDTMFYVVILRKARTLSSAHLQISTTSWRLLESSLPHKKDMLLSSYPEKVSVCVLDMHVLVHTTIFTSKGDHPANENCYPDD
jgi:hypothetical protein